MLDEMSDGPKAYTFEEFWAPAAPRVRAYVLMSIASYHDAEDIVQETALAMSKSMHNYDRERPFLGWALGFARIRILKHLKSTGRDRRMVFTAENLDDIEAAFVEVDTPSEGPVEQLSYCVDKLSKRSRRLFDLRYTSGLSAPEIAAETGMTIDSVYARLSQIRSALRKCIGRRMKTEDIP